MDPIQRPKLTLPEAESALLQERYAEASVILEYGAGGSTVVASEMPEKTIWSVESDADWIDMMNVWFDANEVASRPVLVHGDVGKVKNWGMPVNNAAQARFARYPLAVWDMDGFMQPDLVLIDGRFRVGCLLACLFRSKAPLTVLFDDYDNRPEYHVVETYAQKVETVGRMARFEITPRAIQNDELLEVIGLMQKKR
ncbi:hypothetical protein [Pelagovum pacificum]|uniref:hypothetical protein n=1 Tax=Pelagovum pacificum TaxID=2588711 RepID=UPI001E410EBE|nr:hypothetical protein [Pelagovum pacificum]